MSRRQRRIVEIGTDVFGEAANQHDRIAHGTSNTGSKNPAARLNESDVRRIKKLLATTSPQEVASRFDVSVSAIKNIKNGYNWRHIHV